MITSCVRAVSFVRVGCRILLTSFIFCQFFVVRQFFVVAVLFER